MTTGRLDPPSVTTPRRRPELDAIRALVVVGLVFFHAGMVFDSRDDFYVKNAETTDATMIAAGFAVVWAMPMLFLISGLGAWHSVRRRGPGGFTRERLVRLGVPLLFAFVALLPIPQWVRLRADPAYQDSYLEFWPHFFDVHLDLTEFPFILQGDYFEAGHLWFVVLLLVFSLLLAPLVRWVPDEVRQRLRDGAARATRRRGVILLPVVPLALLNAAAGMESEYAGWNRWAYLLFFGFGFMLAADDRFREAMRRDARLAAVLGGILFVSVLPGMLTADDPFADMTPLAIVTRIAYGAAGWCWVVAILGLIDRRRFRKTNAPAPATRADPGTAEPPAPASFRPSAFTTADRRRAMYAYLAAALLPLYILHQPIVVGVAYWVVQWDAPILIKYVVIVVASHSLTFAAYEVFVRRWRITRFLLGMRG